MSFATTSASERRFLPPAVAVSTVAFALQPPIGAPKVCDQSSTSAEHPTLWIPLVRRTRPPFSGQWALPGGPIPWDEALDATALRTLQDAAGATPEYLEQLYSFGAVGRSAEAQRIVTIAYWALFSECSLRTRSTGTSTDSTEISDPNIAWCSADQIPKLAFDHAAIVHYALNRMRQKTEYSTAAYRFLGAEFTLAQLRTVHEAILGQSVDQANFRRQALGQGYLIDTGQVASGGRHRPAKLYRFRDPTGLPEWASLPEQAGQAGNNS